MVQKIDTAGLAVDGEVGEGLVAPAEIKLLCADLERDLSSLKDVAEGGAREVVEFGRGPQKWAGEVSGRGG